MVVVAHLRIPLRSRVRLTRLWVSPRNNPSRALYLNGRCCARDAAATPPLSRPDLFARSLRARRAIRSPVRAQHQSSPQHSTRAAKIPLLDSVAAWRYSEGAKYGTETQLPSIFRELPCPPSPAPPCCLYCCCLPVVPAEQNPLPRPPSPTPGRQPTSTNSKLRRPTMPQNSPRTTTSRWPRPVSLRTHRPYRPRRPTMPPPRTPARQPAAQTPPTRPHPDPLPPVPRTRAPTPRRPPSQKRRPSRPARPSPVAGTSSSASSEPT